MEFQSHILAENIFSRIFGGKQSGGGNQNKGADPNIVQTGPFSFRLGPDGVINRLVGTIPFEVLNYKWSKDKLSWILNADYVADGISFNFKKGIVGRFDGDWNAGPFYGEKFLGVFKGNEFQGKFLGSFRNYQSSPQTFIDGTFIDYKNGILGLSNTTSFIGKSFNAIAVPENYYINIVKKPVIDTTAPVTAAGPAQFQGKAYIKVIKRLDNTNSQFRYEVYNETLTNKTPKPELKLVEWPTIRAGWSRGIATVNLQSKSILGILDLPEGIESVQISPSTQIGQRSTAATTASAATQPTSGTLKGISLDFIKEIPLTSTQAEVDISLPSQAEYQDYIKFVKPNIESGYINYALKKVKQAVAAGQINGYSKYWALKGLFSDVVGKEPADDTLKEAMNALHNFFLLFVNNTVDDQGRSDAYIQDAINNKIKAYIGFNPPPPTTATGGKKPRVV